jgi:hypothetical protein
MCVSSANGRVHRIARGHQVQFQAKQNCYRNLAFGEKIMSRTQTFDKFPNFESGVTSVNSGKHSGHPSMWGGHKNVEQITELFHENKYFSVQYKEFR